jgi:hypothetical protein
MPRKSFTIATAMLFAALPMQAALAWGASGHRMIGEVAMRNLPNDLPAFLTSNTAIAAIGEIAREPDRARGSGIPHDSDLDPAHFVDAADDATIGALPLVALPPTRAAYAAALRAAGTDDYKAGYLPYAIEEGWQQLVKDFAYWRADVAAQKLALTAEERQWLADDQRRREMLTIRDLGFWSHFVGDASQPMHVSVHYDGWGDFPNPAGYPNARGLHSQFESAFVHANVQESDLQAAMPAYRPRSGTIQNWVGAYLAASQGEVVPFYRLAKVRPFNTPDADEKAFAVERLAAGAAQLRDLVAEAWRASTDARISNYPAITAADIGAGTVPAASVMPALRGND